MNQNILLLSLLIHLPMLATPFQVASGAASAEQAGSTLHIENSDGAVLHWDNFSIGKNQTVHFAQPHPQSMVINEVIGVHPSLIEGILSSNGKVALINPQGIYIQAGALIQTAGFIAATTQLQLDEGCLWFKPTGSGEIVHAGQIECPDGDIIFIANRIDHSGVSEGANVHLLSGQEVFVHPAGKKGIYIHSQQWDAQIPSYETAIRHTGQMRAYGMHEENGKVFLVSSYGKTTVDGEIIAPAGEIRILGEDVELGATAHLNASGSASGTVLIGGSYQGSDPAIKNSKQTFVAKGALVQANHTKQGSGGTVIYWSDGITRVDSHTEVQGGPEGGDGGFIEISGKAGFFYRGSTDRSAHFGNPGMLFFDPEADVTIDTIGPTNINSVSPFVPTDSPATILDTDLITALNGGPVTITTNGPAVVTPGLGDLLFNTSLTWTSNNSFICTVGHDATIPTGVTLTNNGTGDFTINANRAISVSGTIACSGGNISLNGGLGGFASDSFTGVAISPNVGDAASITTTGNGNISLIGIGGNAGGSGIAAGEFATDFTIQTDQGNITINGTASGGGIYFIHGLTGITTQDGTISINGSSSSYRGTVFHGGVNVQATGTGDISIQGNGSNFGVYFFNPETIQTVSGPITINAASSQTTAFLTNGAPIDITSSSGDITITAIGPTGIVLEQSTLIATSGAIFIDSTGDVSIANNSRIQPEGSNPLTCSVTGNLSLLPGALGPARIGSPNTLATASMSIHATGNLALTGFDPYYALIGHGDPSSGASNLSGNIGVTAASVSLIAQDAGGFAQIGHVNQTAGGSILAGSLSIRTSQDVQLTGGATAYTRIGHGGQVGLTTFLPATTQVIAGTTIALTSGHIASPGGALTLVVDNNFPSFPNFGSGAISMDVNSTLSSADALRIYTATQDLNTFAGLINGQNFSAGPFDVDSSTEQWRTYYPGGTYGSTLFKIYYKNPIVYDTQSYVSANTTANLVALSNLLPILRSPGHIPLRFPSYVAMICRRKTSQLKCSPTLSPYDSFIFEDTIWWRTP